MSAFPTIGEVKHVAPDSGQGQPGDHWLHGVNIDRAHRLPGMVLSATSDDMLRLRRTRYFHRKQALAWLQWALGKAGFGDRESREMGKRMALSYLGTINARGAR